MKAFLFLSTLFLLSFCKAKAQEDANKLLEDFITKATPGLANWMKEHGHVPEHLDAIGDIQLKTVSGVENYPYYDLTGEIRNRYYHGAEKNIRAVDVSVNLARLAFDFDLHFGDGKNDFIEGTYSLNGTVVNYFNVHANGTFNKTNQFLTMHIEEQCRLQVTPDGYFEMKGCLNRGFPPKFEHFTLSPFHESEFTRSHIQPIIGSWYYAQFIDFPNVSKYWFYYMQEVFAATPIVDIIGKELPPTVTASAKSLGKSPIFNSQPHFDFETNQFIQKITITY